MEKIEKRKEIISERDRDDLIRIMSTDIPSKKNVYSGLTRIKGVSWGFSNAVCNILKIDKKKKIAELNEEEIKKITEFIKSPAVPKFLLNRRNDFETGIDSHISGTNIDLRKEFDIKRLKKIKSYKGIRHGAGQPVRGQRTKSHFRKNKTLGVSRKK